MTTKDQPIFKRKRRAITSEELERDRSWRAIRDEREHKNYLAQIARERASDVLDGAVRLNDLSDVPTEHLFEDTRDELRDVPPERWQEKRWKPSLPIVQMDADEFEKLEPYRP